MLKDFLEYKGNADIYGSKDAVRNSFKLGLIEDGDSWMQMIKSRNLTSHTYDENTADEIVFLIKDMYFEEFEKLIVKMEILKIEESI